MIYKLLILLFTFYTTTTFAINEVIRFGTPPRNLSQISLIDARSRDSWLKGRLPNSIYLEWEHFSQPGAGSRGSLRVNPQQIADDLAHIGIHKDHPVYIYGRGVKGSGNEGRLGWMFYWLGFKKIYITDFNTAKAWSDKDLQKGPHFPKSIKPWKVDLRTNDILSQNDYKKWIVDKKPHVLIGLRGNKNKENLPGVYSKLDLEIYWTIFLTHPKVAQQRIDDYLKSKSLNKTAPIVPISFAGLRSAYVYLLLKSWGYNGFFIPDGFSMELK